MFRQPDKILVFSSESDDAIGLQIYRLLYGDTSYDLMFIEGDYERTKDITDYMLPTNDGDEIFVNAEQLVDFFKQVEEIEKINYDSLGMFYDYNLGFEFSDEMIDEIASQIQPDEIAPEVERILKGFSFISQDWELLNWKQSKSILIENLDFVLRSEKDLDPDRIEAIISESAEFRNMLYPELFEVLLYAAELYEETHLFAKTKNKMFCLKTSSKGKYPNFIYSEDEIEINEDDETVIVELDVELLNDWYDKFSNLKIEEG